jgi:hypothetical protein
MILAITGSPTRSPPANSSGCRCRCNESRPGQRK